MAGRVDADELLTVAARRARISGRVQGVGYRAWLQREARRRGVCGWTRNRRDGWVEAQFEGDADALDALLIACADGPPFAQVERVESAPNAAQGAFDFTIAKTV